MRLWGLALAVPCRILTRRFGGFRSRCAPRTIALVTIRRDAAFPSRHACDFDAFVALVERPIDPADYPLAARDHPGRPHLRRDRLGPRPHRRRRAPGRPAGRAHCGSRRGSWHRRARGSRAPRRGRPGVGGVLGPGRGPARPGRSRWRSLRQAGRKRPPLERPGEAGRSRPRRLHRLPPLRRGSCGLRSVAWAPLPDHRAG